MNKTEEMMKAYYTDNVGSGLSKIFTPLEVREKMTVHANVEDKILVMFNFEFCYDLWKKGCRNVMFVSDDQLKVDLVKKTWGYDTELIEPKSINKTFKDMKFDLIISNPPYNKGIDLKILESILDLSERICFVHPIGYLIEKKGTYANIRDKISNRLNSVELFNGNVLFKIAIFVECGIVYITKKSKKIKFNNVEYSNIHEINKYENCYYPSISKKIIEYSSKSNIWKIREIGSSSSHENDFFVSLSGGRAHVEQFNEKLQFRKSDYYTIISPSVTPKNIKTTHHNWRFSSITDANNFIKYLKTKFSRFALSILKNNMHIDSGELVYVPWFDFSRSWTDEECAAELGITNEELLWMIQQIPNYYPEDEKIYTKLENKLKN